MAYKHSLGFKQLSFPVGMYCSSTQFDAFNCRNLLSTFSSLYSQLLLPYEMKDQLNLILCLMPGIQVNKTDTIRVFMKLTVKSYLKPAPKQNQNWFSSGHIISGEQSAFWQLLDEERSVMGLTGYTSSLDDQSFEKKASTWAKTKQCEETKVENGSTWQCGCEGHGIVAQSLQLCPTQRDPGRQPPGFPVLHFLAGFAKVHAI